MNFDGTFRKLKIDLNTYVLSMANFHEQFLRCSVDFKNALV